MKKIIRATVVIILLAFFTTSCKKDQFIQPPESPKELKIVNWDSSKFGGYVPCGSVGLVDGNGLQYQFIASSEEGEVTITNFVYHINVNDNSKPFTMISMWDGYYGNQHDVLVTGSEVEFTNMHAVVPEGYNGRFFGASITYSGAGRNGVMSGRTVSSITLTSLTYVDRSGLKKTIHPNFKSPDRMSAYSLLWMQPQYWGSAYSGLSIGQNKIFEQFFNSSNGDHTLKEIPLKIKMIDCSMGITPQITIQVNDGSTGLPINMPTTVLKIDDTTFIVKPSLPVKIKKDKPVNIVFIGEIQSMTITANTKIHTSVGNLKYMKYVEDATGTEFLFQNENFMWTTYYYSSNNIDQYYLELYP